MTGRGIRCPRQLEGDWKGRSDWLHTKFIVRGCVQKTIMLLKYGFRYRKSDSPHVQQIPFFINGNFRAAWALRHSNGLNTATLNCLAQREKGGRAARGNLVGVSGGLTKNHFNRNSWVMALPKAKNNISSMSAIRRGLSQAPWPALASSQAQACLQSFPKLMSSHCYPPRAPWMWMKGRPPAPAQRGSKKSVGGGI